MLRSLFATAAICAALFAQETRPASRPATDLPMITTPTGLKYAVLVPGAEGAHPQRGDFVTVNYRGTLEDGMEFDASKAPFEFRLGQVIEGWNEGLKLMTAGAKFRFVIPADLAYGAQGSGRVPPNATLVFEVELVSFREGERLPEPPKYVALDPAKTKTTDAGVKYEIVSEGAGDKAGPDDTLVVHYSIFGPDKRLLMATAAAGGDPQKIPAKMLQGQTGLAFMRAMLPEMKAGETRRLEVPAAQAFGDRVWNGVPGGSTTYWELQLAKIGRPTPPPAFVKPADMKLTATTTGLQYEIVTEGTGRMPKLADKVEVHYSGWLEDGKPFDSSYSRGDTTTFGVTQVIPGWTEGLQLMKEGAVARFVIPAKLAYGERGTPDGRIPPNSNIVFYVELVKVK